MFTTAFVLTAGERAAENKTEARFSAITALDSCRSHWVTPRVQPVLSHPAEVLAENCPH